MSASELGASSSLHPAGTEAAMVADLFWIMLAGGLVIWTLTLAAALYAVYGRRRPAQFHRRTTMWLIAGGGLIAPSVVLGALLIHGLSTMVALQKPGDGLQIVVTGERFWWRVQYLSENENETGDANGGPVDLANEIRLPLGRRSELLLRSPEVIHSLWIPSLAGKLDMLPGRETRLVLEPTRVGRYRGVCAEYCGVGHAHMTFTVDVLPEDVFSVWLDQQRSAARPAESGQTRAGAAVFTSYGCGACHAIRGTDARGLIGPDLTHLGSRPTLAATDLPMDQPSLQRWIRDPTDIKPGVLMPAFTMVPDDELAALSAYLLSLK